MIDLERFDDVTRVRLASWGSRAAGLDVSAYIVRGVLVDSGYPRAATAMASVLDEVTIRGAMITHWHEDHAGNATLLASRGVPLVLHPQTEAKLRAFPPIRLYRRVVWGTPPSLRVPITPFDEPALRFVHTPGHSPDHHVVWDHERATLFSGDLWLGVRSAVMHEREDPYRIVQSLRDVIALQPARMFDAHRGLVREPAQALTAKVTWMEDRIAEIETKIAAGWSDGAIVRAVLGGEELVARLSQGEYARANFVRAVRARGAGRGERGA
jgi:glyoxylase-like metal-dependent hydrolase (beta-lactamase superfamily II)